MSLVPKSALDKFYGKNEELDIKQIKIVKPMKKDDKKQPNTLLVNLKYDNGLPVIKEIKRISKPGRRIYARADSISKIKNGLGVAIVSTSKGIMSDDDARTKNIGGEIICRVF